MKQAPQHIKDTQKIAISTHHRTTFDAWVEATRPRTLPVSVAGVLAGTGCAAMQGSMRLLPALICLIFAIIAQIASNFANEYYDYANGLDKKGREGFRRGVTEGDISPSAMLHATWSMILIDALAGCILLLYGGWWLIFPGIAIAIFAIAYSAGPYPLSHHGLGDIAVIIFFGLVPVTLTAYVQTGVWSWTAPTIPVSLAIGLMAANVLVVNNYRDADNDRLVGKRTTVVIFGRHTMGIAYLVSGIIAALLGAIFTYTPTHALILIPTAIYLVLHIMLYYRLTHRQGAALNKVLGITAANLLLYTLITTIIYMI